jgi:hypothetical protein
MKISAGSVECQEKIAGQILAERLGFEPRIRV